MKSLPDTPHPEPWYRQFWPWFLIALPLTAVCASMVTIYLATTRSHSMVVDDYARIGLSTQQRFERDQQARELGLSASLTLTGSTAALELRAPDFTNPDVLFLTLSHPTQPEKDRRVELVSDGTRYLGQIDLPDAERWYIQLEPTDFSWRLAGEFPAGLSRLELRPGGNPAGR